MTEQHSLIRALIIFAATIAVMAAMAYGQDEDEGIELRAVRRQPSIPSHYSESEAEHVREVYRRGAIVVDEFVGSTDGPTVKALGGG